MSRVLIITIQKPKELVKAQNFKQEFREQSLVLDTTCGSRRKFICGLWFSRKLPS